MGIGRLFGWGKSKSCHACGTTIQGNSDLCSYCRYVLEVQMFNGGAGGAGQVTWISTAGGLASGQYWGANSTFYGGASGPTYTGLGGAFYATVPAAAVPSALGGGTKRKPVENAGIRAGEIIAFRCWSLDGRVGENYYLRSTYAHYTWEPGQVATLSPEADPDWHLHHRNYDRFLERTKIDPYDRNGVRTGIHGFKTAEHMQKEMGGNGWVYGTVAMWGDVIEHELGFRSEFARITSIDSVGGWIGPHSDRILDKLRKTYGVEGKTYRDFTIGV